MTRELLIGLTGVKGVGKSTLAAMLAELIPDVGIVAWADALKDEVADLVERSDWTNPWSRPSREEMERLKAEVYGPICQGWGAYRRRQDPDYWIKAWERAAPARVIVPDTRHHNEADYIKANGGLLVSVFGDSHWVDDVRSMAHESERHARELAARAHRVVYNTGSLQVLREQAAELAAVILRASADVGSAA
jgi:energy-coupling factor transporter ATP-binding protein EcfA2